MAFGVLERWVSFSILGIRILSFRNKTAIFALNRKDFYV